jgi:hypothetical protein
VVASVKQHGTVKACFFSAAECESGSQSRRHAKKQKTDQQSDQQNRPSVSTTLSLQAKATEEATVGLQSSSTVEKPVFSAVKCESGLQSRRHASKETKAAVRIRVVARKRTVTVGWRDGWTTDQLWFRPRFCEQKTCTAV